MKIWSKSRFVNIVVVIWGLFVIGETLNAVTRPTATRVQPSQKSTTKSSGWDGASTRLAGPSRDGGV
jgi:hypothetical protein